MTMYVYGSYVLFATPYQLLHTAINGEMVK